MRLEELEPDAAVRGVLPDAAVVVVAVDWHGSEALTLTYRTPEGRRAEVETLRALEAMAAGVRDSGQDTKWLQLAQILEELFSSAGNPGSGSRKLVIFTEHRDTLRYLESRIGVYLGRPGSIAVIHGGMGREDRRKSQNRFLHDPEVQVLLATDAAGEGINSGGRAGLRA